MNVIIQTSKDVKNNTKLSSGTTSVAYAAIQYIMEFFTDYESKRILVYGLGEIGKNTCLNLLEYSTNNEVTLINRTQDKAEKFRNAHSNIKVAKPEELKQEIERSDILIVATGADKPTVDASHLTSVKELLILDLSLPENVAVEVQDIPGVKLVNVDELSVITQKTIAMREQEIPATQAIIAKHRGEFNEWIADRKFVPAVNALKKSLKEIQQNEINYQCNKI